MPTVYTHVLQEKDDMTLKEFTLRCVRAFGACIEQRDESMDAPLNMEEQPSTFYLEEKEKAINKLREAEGRDDMAWEISLRNEIAAVEVSRQSCEKERAKHRRNYLRMLTMVQDWKPPTDDHVELQKFMIQQIQESIRFDCGPPHYYDEQITTLTKLTVEEYKQEKLQDLRDNIVRYEEEYRKEVTRVNERNQWKKQLIESLKETY